MASACRDLISLMLQRIDRDPIGELEGVEVERFGRPALDLLLERRVLVQRPDLTELDGCPVQWLGGKPFVFDLEGDHPPEEVDPRQLITYEIDVLALCHALRRASDLAGPPVEEVSGLACFIGAHGSGNRRRFVCFARAVRDDAALDLVPIIRARVGSNPLLLLTARPVELRRRTRQHLEEGRVRVLPLLDALDPATSDPFTLRVAILDRAWTVARSDARLRIDTAGRQAMLDAEEIFLSRLEFAVFTALAEEASDKNGFVPRDDLLQIIEAQRSDPEDPATAASLDNILSRIRRALAARAGIPSSDMTALVETSRKVGHRLNLRRLGLEPTDVAIV
jgi:DNA-binding response OmpR family regulator